MNDERNLELGPDEDEAGYAEDSSDDFVHLFTHQDEGYEPGWEGTPAEYAPEAGAEELDEDELEELALEDPVAAMNLLATQRAAEIAAFQQQQLAQQLQPILGPMVERQNNELAAEQVNAPRARFGDLFDAETRRAVAETVARDPAYFVDPATRQQRLEQAAGAHLYDRQLRADQGSDIVDDRRVGEQFPDRRLRAGQRGARPAGAGRDGPAISAAARGGRSRAALAGPAGRPDHR